MAKVQNPNFGKQENGEEDADADAEGNAGRDPKENSGRDGHTLLEERL